jgi:putative phosphoribosyl transferase
MAVRPVWKGSLELSLVSVSFFPDRRHAGRALALELRHYAQRPDVVVLALPRGGVPVAFEVADALGAELDVFLVRKLGLPGHPEYAMGAIATGGVRVLDDEAICWYRVPQSTVDAVIASERQELARLEAAYRDGGSPVSIEGQVVILVDDGLATGSSMRAAIAAVRRLGPARLVVAVPVGPPSTCRDIQQVADEVVCARSPEPFSAVGQWYRDFSQTTAEEVRSLLGAHRDSRHAPRDSPGTDHPQRPDRPEQGTMPTTATGPYTISIPLGHGEHLEADLQVPAGARGVVIFTHGGGSSRFSARNQAVAEALVRHRFATLLLDLLTRREEAADANTGIFRFDIRRLADRVALATDWTAGREEVHRLPIGYFGASTGAAAALVAAAERPALSRAVVSRGGRPDLAGESLHLVTVPTRLIVGGNDEAVVRTNEEAMTQMPGIVDLRIIPDATHLFEEAGALEQVERLAADWFARYLR